MKDTQTNLQESIVNELRESEDIRVKVAITDIDGVLRGKYILKDKFLAAVKNGFGFCDVVFGWDCADVCYDNVKVTGWHTGYPDAKVNLDLSTYRRVPWDNNVAFFLGHFTAPDGSPLSTCPRRLLQKQVQKADEMGFQTCVGTEFEWFNFEETPQSLKDKGFRADRLKPITPGMFGYSILRSSLKQGYFADLMNLLGQFGIPIEGLHTETGPGVYEAAIRYTDGLEAGDRAVLFKTSVKEIAYSHGVVPTFMARWNTSLPGCSGHIHQSLVNNAGDNAFHDPGDPHGMSDIFRSYLAGQMACLPEILPMLAPTVNSYKRLVEGFWAPTRVTWGIDNRTVALRAIQGGSSTRLETRVGGADLNGYLGISACLAAGLYGIEEKLELKEAPVKGNGYEVEDAVRLPGSLKEAAQRMGSSKLARRLFGDGFVDHFVATRLWEQRQYDQSVTDWELKRYFEII
jgi:glutamine synthetase